MKLKEIEKKYPVSFKINLIKEDIRVFCTDAIYELINKGKAISFLHYKINSFKSRC